MKLKCIRFLLIDLYNGSCLKFACCCQHLDEHPNICREVILLYIILNKSYSNNNDNKSSFIFDLFIFVVVVVVIVVILKIHK